MAAMLEATRGGVWMLPSALALALSACAGGGADEPRASGAVLDGGLGAVDANATPPSAAGSGAGLAGVGGSSLAGMGGGAADGGVAPPFPPEPPPGAIFVPPFEQPEGDPDRGYDYLINGSYQRLGPDLAAFKVSQPPIKDEDRLPGRRGVEHVREVFVVHAAESPEGKKVAGVNCLGCHATHLQGKLIVGLGRANRMVRLDDVNVLGIAFANPLELNSSVSTLNRLLGGVALGVMDVFPYLASHRVAETLAWTDVQQFNPDAGVQGWVDIPPWWRTAKKNALYSNGAGRGVQSHHMGFMSIFSVEDTTEAAEIEKNFYDVGAYIRSIEAPKFPGAIDLASATRGEGVFVERCASCHGTYGEQETYPNLIIPLAEVGTDPSLAKGHWMAPAVDWYARSWYAREGKSWLEMTEGYYAPPLDGVWATAPFFHNGSVPTLDGVLDPKKRPTTWTSNMSADDYDLDRVGWMSKPFDGELALDGGFGTFDVSRPGNSNAGHTYAADLSEDEQRALLEYLKTL